MGSRFKERRRGGDCSGGSFKIGVRLFGWLFRGAGEAIWEAVLKLGGNLLCAGFKAGRETMWVATLRGETI